MGNKEDAEQAKEDGQETMAGAESNLLAGKDLATALPSTVAQAEKDLLSEKGEILRQRDASASAPIPNQVADADAALREAKIGVLQDVNSDRYQRFLERLLPYELDENQLEDILTSLEGKKSKPTGNTTHTSRRNSYQNETRGSLNQQPVLIVGLGSANPVDPSSQRPTNIARQQRVRPETQPGAEAIGPAPGYVPPAEEPRPSEDDVQMPLVEDSVAAAEEGLANATEVSNYFSQEFVEQVDPNQEAARKAEIRAKANKKLMGTLATHCLVALLALVGGFFIGRSTKSCSNSTATLPCEDSQPTQVPSLAPSQVPSVAPSAVLDELWASLPSTTKSQARGDPDSPPGQAWAWLSGHPDLPGMELWRQEQLFALAVFFHAMRGENWPREFRESWLQYDTHECNWISSHYGFFWDDGGWFQYDDPIAETCNNQTEQVVGLFINELSLDGLQPYIPPEIALLSALEELHLFQNSINDVTLEDFVPFSALGSLPNFKVLHIGGQSTTVADFEGFSGSIPTTVGFLTQLRELNVGSSRMTGTLPSEIGALEHLRHLNLGKNFLEGSIPNWLGSLTQLTHLTLQKNQLTGAFPEWCEWYNLETLFLTDNYLTGSISNCGGGFPNMTMISLGRNMLTGSLPDVLGTMTNLADLWVEENKISGLPSAEVWQSLQALERLVLDGNQLTGLSRIVEFAMLLPELRELRLADNLLTGPIPSEIGLLSPELFNLELGENALTSTIPTEIGQTGISYLYLQNNQMNGPIPSEFYLLPALNKLVLSHNYFTGTLSSELGIYTYVTQISVQNNLFTGTIPSELGNPDFFFEVLQLGNNQLSGSIPPELGNATSLEIIHLQNLNLTGSIPSELGMIRWQKWDGSNYSLVELDLSFTSLSGALPSELEHLVTLGYLNLTGAERLNGAIPDGLCSLQTDNGCSYSIWGGDVLRNCSLQFDCIPNGGLCGCDCDCLNTEP